jgi:protein SCO1/2
VKQIISFALTFVAISLVVAVVAMKYIVPPAHVQIDAVPVAGVSSPSTSKINTDASSTVEFNLIDENGTTFTGENLKGKVSIVNFVFRNCKTVCPLVMSKTRSVASDLTDHYKYLRLVSITVDPTNDTQEVLAAWKKDVAIKDLEWTFLTGDKAEVFATVEQDFKQAVMDNAANMDMPIAHSSYLVLVDPEGKIAGFYDSNDTYKMKELTEQTAKLTAALKTSH